MGLGDLSIEGDIMSVLNSVLEWCRRLYRKGKDVLEIVTTIRQLYLAVGGIAGAVGIVSFGLPALWATNALEIVVGGDGTIKFSPDSGGRLQLTVPLEVTNIVVHGISVFLRGIQALSVRCDHW